MGNTNYYQAQSIAQAVEYLKKYQGSAKLLAGGTDLMVQMNQYSLPEDLVLVGIEDIPEMKGIQEKEDGIHIGSMVTDAEIIKSKLIQKKAYALYLAASESASPQVRNRATVGGNVATASPSGDVQAALIALEALAVIEGENGSRVIPVQNIPVFVKKTCLEPTEIIREFVVKPTSEAEGSFFVKMGKRKAMTISIVDVAVRVELSEDKSRINKAIIAAGACAPTVVRLSALENELVGKGYSEKQIKEATEKAIEILNQLQICEHQTGIEKR